MALIQAVRVKLWPLSGTFLAKNLKLRVVTAGKPHLVAAQKAVVWLPCRSFTLGVREYSAETETADGEENTGEEEGNETSSKAKVDPSKDRSIKIPPETSIKYLGSESYKETYGDDPIWKNYRRNHKYAFPPKTTRATCVKNDIIVTGNPCPICRDEYLVLDYRNVKLLKQFISPYSDEVIGAYYTGLCRRKHFELLVAVEKARDVGYIPFYVPKRYYNYEEYYPKLDESLKKDC